MLSKLEAISLFGADFAEQRYVALAPIHTDRSPQKLLYGSLSCISLSCIARCQKSLRATVENASERNVFLFSHSPSEGTCC